MRPTNPNEIAAWITRGDQTVLLRKQPTGLVFSDAQTGEPAVHVNDRRAYQTMDGFGFSLTGGSAYLINQLPLATRAQLLREIFSTDDDAIGVSYLRLTLGASDLSRASFSYDDMPDGETDVALERFDLGAGDAEVIPLLLDILALNPELPIIASPWSAPPWMKTNRRFIGGELRPECYSVYARYFVRYIEGMRDHGIRIQAISVQNEPLNFKNEPSMVMSAEAQTEFIRDHLGPAFVSAGLDVEIFCWDHNCDVPEYPLTVLRDPAARRYVTGVAWHLYAGDIAVLSELHQAYPELKMYFTEQWVGADGQFCGDLLWHFRHVMIGATRNWARLVMEWNLAGDPQCGPHTPRGEPCCVGALTIDGDTVVRNVAYYVIGHAAKFVRPGSVRIESHGAEPLPNVAFMTPDGRIVLIVLNASAIPQRFAIHFRGRTAATELHPQSVATYVWCV